MSKGRIVLAAALVAPFLWVMGLGQPAYAGGNGNTKLFAVSATPSMGAGETNALTITITNENPLQTLGSLNMNLPSGTFVLPDQTSTVTTNYVVSPAPTATVSSGVVMVRGMSLPAGSSVSFPVQAYAPCVDNTWTWSITAKQANDFSGQPGNNFTLDPTNSQTNATTTGLCGLKFLTGNEPADTQVSTPISSTQFLTPAQGGAPVDVGVYDDLGNPLNPADASAANTSITATPSVAPNVPETEASAVVNGVVLAQFTKVQVGTTNGGAALHLNATGVASDRTTLLTPGASTDFLIWQAGVNCTTNGKQCGTATGNSSQNNTNSGASGTPTGIGTGTPAIIEISQGIQDFGNCGGKYFEAPVSTTEQSTTTAFGNGVITVTITIAASAVMGPSSQYEVCYYDANPFPVLGGGTSTANSGVAQYLATCKATGGTAPCVNSISKNKQGAIVEVVQVPPGDPCFH